MPLVRSGREAKSEIFHKGGPPSPASIFNGLRFTTPAGLNVETSTWERILGSIPAYSRAKTGMSAPIMVSAERARAPTE